MSKIPDSSTPTAGLTSDHLRRYRAARAKIDPEIRFIHSLTALLAKFEAFDRDRVSIDPVALGIVHGTLEQSVLAVWRELDDFLLISAAEKPARDDRDARAGVSAEVHLVGAIGAIKLRPTGSWTIFCWSRPPKRLRGTIEALEPGFPRKCILSRHSAQ